MNRNARQRPFAMLLIIALLLWGLTPLHADTVYQKASEWAKPEWIRRAKRIDSAATPGQDMTRPATREEVVRTRGGPVLKPSREPWWRQFTQSLYGHQ
jgi:hypothetical protein